MKHYRYTRKEIVRNWLAYRSPSETELIKDLLSTLSDKECKHKPILTLGEYDYCPKCKNFIDREVSPYLKKECNYSAPLDKNYENTLSSPSLEKNSKKLSTSESKILRECTCNNGMVRADCPVHVHKIEISPSLDGLEIEELKTMRVMTLDTAEFSLIMQNRNTINSLIRNQNILIKKLKSL